jgi:hypothetical protein
MPLDEADLKKIGELITAGVAAGVKDLPTADVVTKMVNQGIAKAVGDLKIDDKVTEAVKKAAPKSEDPADDKGDSKGKDKSAKDSKVDPAVARLQEQLAELERKNREAEERANQEKASRQEQEAIGALRDALSANGVPSDRQGIAIAKLYHADKLIKRDADGKLFVPVNRKAGYTDNLEVGAFVKEYLATDEGKTFLPPKGSNGTGDGAGTRVQGGGGAVKIENLQIPL